MLGRFLLAALFLEFGIVMPAMPKAVMPAFNYGVADPREPSNGNRRHRRRVKAGVA